MLGCKEFVSSTAEDQWQLDIRQHVTFSYEGSCVKKNALIVVLEDI